MLCNVSLLRATRAGTRVLSSTRHGPGRKHRPRFSPQGQPFSAHHLRGNLRLVRIYKGVQTRTYTGSKPPDLFTGEPQSWFSRCPSRHREVSSIQAAVMPSCAPPVHRADTMAFWELGELSLISRSAIGRGCEAVRQPLLLQNPFASIHWIWNDLTRWVLCLLEEWLELLIAFCVLSRRTEVVLTNVLHNTILR